MMVISKISSLHLSNKYLLHAYHVTGIILGTVDMKYEGTIDTDPDLL